MLPERLAGDAEIAAAERVHRRQGDGDRAGDQPAEQDIEENGRQPNDDSSRELLERGQVGALGVDPSQHGRHVEREREQRRADRVPG
jgi:hypothetical protein